MDIDLEHRYEYIKIIQDNTPHNSGITNYIFISGNDGVHMSVSEGPTWVCLVLMVRWTGCHKQQ